MQQKKPPKNPKEFSLLCYFLIGIIQIITDTLGNVNTDSYLALFSPFIQKYYTLLLRQKKTKPEIKKLKCNLNEAILLRLRNCTEQLIVLQLAKLNSMTLVTVLSILIVSQHFRTNFGKWSLKGKFHINIILLPYQQWTAEMQLQL